MILLLLVIPPTLYLFFLTLGACFPRKKSVKGTKEGRLVVVIPAHNEEKAIGRALESFGACDLVVVADNCTDKTGEIAAKKGARVFVRDDLERKGKNYALSFAFESLLPEGYEWFVVVDADSVVEANFIESVQQGFARGYDAIQCRYGVLNGEDSMRTRLMKIAFLAINYLRPRGREFWGLSVGIFGNGFGLTKEALMTVPYSVDSVVEDLSYHVKLVEKGFRVRFCEDTAVYGEIPVEGRGVVTQRVRWEGGRFQEIVKTVPRILREGNIRLVEPLFDLLLLPLGYHVLLIFLLMVLTTYQGLAFFAFGVVCFHLLSAMLLGGAGVRDYLALGYIPVYLVWKVINIPRILWHSKGKMAWIRTDRS